MNLVFYCPKGGVGKTSSSQNFGALLRASGHSVALYDLDLIQGNLRDAKFLRGAKAIRKAGESRDFEYSIYDCPPSGNVQSRTALEIADIVIVPAQLEEFGMKALDAIIEILHDAQAVGFMFEYRVLPTMLIPELDISLMHEAAIQKRFGALKMPSIRLDFAVKSAAHFKLPVVEYAPESPAALDYRAAVAALLAGQENL